MLGSQQIHVYLAPRVGLMRFTPHRAFEVPASFSRPVMSMDTMKPEDAKETKRPQDLVNILHEERTTCYDPALLRVDVVSTDTRRADQSSMLAKGSDSPRCVIP